MHNFAPSPIRRSEWLAARAALASRRDVRLALTTATAFVFVLAMLMTASDTWRPFAHRILADPPAEATVPPIDRASLLEMFAAALIVGLLLGYALNLAREMMRPRLAGPQEAERVSGAPVIAVITTGGRSRRDGESIDPYRLAYLSVSPAGARAHVVAVTGDDRALVTAFAARMAHAAATDARATLVLDLDVEYAPASTHYDIRSEPGFSDAIAGVCLWREVAMPIGANEGLSIDVVPAGARRRDLSAQAATVDFEEFVQDHDFCVVVAPGERALRRTCGVIRTPLTILCVREEVTTLSSLSAWRSQLSESAATLHGVVVFRGGRIY